MGDAINLYNDSKISEGIKEDYTKLKGYNKEIKSFISLIKEKYNVIGEDDNEIRVKLDRRGIINSEINNIKNLFNEMVNDGINSNIILKCLSHTNKLTIRIIKTV